VFWKGREGENYTFLEKKQLSRSRRVWNRIGEWQKGFCAFLSFLKSIWSSGGEEETHMSVKKMCPKKNERRMAGF
jgi:hypothetical protein